MTGTTTRIGRVATRLHVGGSTRRSPAIVNAIVGTAATAMTSVRVRARRRRIRRLVRAMTVTAARGSETQKGTDMTGGGATTTIATGVGPIHANGMDGIRGGNGCDEIRC